MSERPSLAHSRALARPAQSRMSPPRTIGGRIRWLRYVADESSVEGVLKRKTPVWQVLYGSAARDRRLSASSSLTLICQVRLLLSRSVSTYLTWCSSDSPRSFSSFPPFCLFHLHSRVEHRISTPQSVNTQPSRLVSFDGVRRSPARAFARSPGYIFFIHYRRTQHKQCNIVATPLVRRLSK